MKVLLHDYTGHAFTAQLARTLAERGAQVTYASFADFDSPKGRAGAGAGDPPGFKAVELRIGGKVAKDHLLKRHFQQLEYARLSADLVRSVRPDVVMSSNTPIEVQEHLLAASREVGAGFVFWVQDIHAEAIGRILAKKSRLVGRLAGTYFRSKEGRCLRRSDGVVVIADAFSKVLGSAPWNLDTSGWHVIENWANIADLPLLPRDNPWAVANMRPDRLRIVYSGTLARKHDPSLLLEMARSFDVDICLFSQGSSADHVRDVAQTEGLHNVFVRPWVSVEDLPSMLAGADILFAVIEPEAGVFSVPSKVLSYLAAGRPILASIPRENLAAVNIEREGAGLVAAPGDTAGLLAHARTLIDNEAMRGEMGRRGRAYADKAFDIQAIAARFETVLGEAQTRGRRAGGNR